MSTASESELKNDTPPADAERVPEVTVTNDLDRQEPVHEPEPEASATESDADGPQPVPETEPEVTVIRDADPSTEILYSEPDDPSGVRQPEANKVEGNRSFTMRELLNDDENASNGIGSDAYGERREIGSPYSQEGSELRITEQDNAAMELIDSVTGVDEEGRSRQRILTYAARRYASAIARNPGDYDALYNWALVLQESADNVNAESTSPSKDALLEEACKKYNEATRLCPTLHDAFYNWAIAISDRAKMRGRTKEAEEFWKQATKNYEKAVQLNWNSPQALNNWGLALQELSAIVPAREKQTIVKTAISKFRAAIQLQFDFHRAIYNLGTVLYGLAEDTLRMGGAVYAKEVSPNELYSQSAIYIASAHSLKPSYSVYSSALKLVRSMLPLPCLKVGYLMAPPVGSPVAPHSDWRRSQFILNHEGLQQIVSKVKVFSLLRPAEAETSAVLHKMILRLGQTQACLNEVSEMDQKQAAQGLRSGDFSNSDKRAVKVNIPDITSVSACSDLTLPPGAGLGIDTIHGPVFLVADSWESLDGWLDAIRLVYTIYARGKSDVLAGIITG